MEERKCRICGNPINKGMYCWDCVRKHQQRKQQRQFFGKTADHPQGMSGEDTKALADLIDKYGISMILRMAGTIVGDNENGK